MMNDAPRDTATYPFEVLVTDTRIPLMREWLFDHSKEPFRFFTSTRYNGKLHNEARHAFDADHHDKLNEIKAQALAVQSGPFSDHEIDLLFNGFSEIMDKLQTVQFVGFANKHDALMFKLRWGGDPHE